jgi:two-component system cell cycle response regulator CtrA
MRSLLIEDDKKFGEDVAEIIKSYGITTDICHSSADGLNRLGITHYDIVIVDLGLPDDMKKETVRAIRASPKIRRMNANIPIIVLTADTSKNQTVTSLSHGADDFISKPCHFGELAARVQRLVMRSKGFDDNKICIGEITIDTQSKKAFINEDQLDLSAKEFMFLELLALQKNVLLNKGTILENLYLHSERIPDQKIVDVMICKIRKEMSKYTSERYLVTKWGMGYMIEDVSKRTRVRAA